MATKEQRHTHHSRVLRQDSERVQTDAFMKRINEIELARPSTESRCERDELIDKFLSRLNPPREKAGYKPLSASRLVGMIRKAKGKADTTTMRDFYTELCRADNFSRLFWGCVKR